MQARDDVGGPSGGSTPEQARSAQRTRNHLLNVLTADDYARLSPTLERVQVKLLDVAAKRGEPFTHIYFPETCVISLVNFMSDGNGVEAGTIGNEGFAGLAAYLEANLSESKTFCQVAGEALRIPVNDVVRAAAESKSLRLMLNRYVQAYLSQVAQSVACNRLHDIEKRCARWLMMTHDRVDQSQPFVLKHEFLALMLGVRRAGVTTAAGALQDKGLIRYRRGSIRILDREGLSASACECYGLVRKQFDQLFLG